MTERRITHIPAGESAPGWSGGASIRCLARGDTTNGAFTLLELTSPAGTGSPPHVHHRDDEALFIIEGTYTIEETDTGASFTASTGDYVFLPRGTRHAFRNPGPGAARLLALTTPAGLDGFFEEVAATPDRAGEIAAKYGLEFPAQARDREE